jgi:hypothetical protein
VRGTWDGMSGVDNNMEEREDAREPRQDKKDGATGGLRCREGMRKRRPLTSSLIPNTIASLLTAPDP